MTTDSHEKKTITISNVNTHHSKYVFKKIYKNQLESIEKDDSEGGSSNDLYAPNFFPTILTNLLPTVPLWSGLLLGDFSRHGESKDYENNAQH